MLCCRWGIQCPRNFGLPTAPLRRPLFRSLLLLELPPWPLSGLEQQTKRLVGPHPKRPFLSVFLSLFHSFDFIFSFFVFRFCFCFCVTWCSFSGVWQGGGHVGPHGGSYGGPHGGSYGGPQGLVPRGLPGHASDMVAGGPSYPGRLSDQEVGPCAVSLSQTCIYDTAGGGCNSKVPPRLLSASAAAPTWTREKCCYSGPRPTT